MPYTVYTTKTKYFTDLSIKYGTEQKTNLQKLKKSPDNRYQNKRAREVEKSLVLGKQTQSRCPHRKRRARR